VTPARLGRLLGAPPVPQGPWSGEAVLASAAVLQKTTFAGAAGRAPAVVVAEEMAARLREEDGVARVQVRPNGFLLVTLSVPGEIVREIVEGGPRDAGAPPEPPLSPAAWPDFPRTWGNPGFAVRYAYARAAAVQRWAGDLGVPLTGFRPGLLTGRHDRAVLRLLAELPSRTTGRDPAWAGYAERLALAYHDAHEHAPALPKGDDAVTETHTARVWLARAVQDVLVALIGSGLPGRI
jgi:arginyl-tRNA synthetase